MRCAGTFLLLLASCLAPPLSANAVPILWTPPGLANAPGLANTPGLAPVLTSVVVPEPGALSILVLGLGLLVIARKKKATTHHH